MATDAWLLAGHRAGTQPPCLRFYTWEPAAISLGYHQKTYPQHWQALAAAGHLELVRRPSGGRAVLHEGDLTYAVVTSGLERRRLAAYARICEFLISGWRELGVALQLGRVGRDYTRQANCFALATGADLVTAAGQKAIGSAQLWQGEALLQHGSMRLARDSGLYARVFGEPFQAPLPNTPPHAEILGALCKAACECFEIDLIEQPLAPAECEAIARECQQWTIFRSG